MKQLDIKAAHLNEDINEKIYMNIPSGNINYKKNKLWLLNKTL